MPNTAVYVGEDLTTKGDWVGVYGSLGYRLSPNSNMGGLPDDTESFLTTFGPVNGLDHNWAASTTDIRALENPSYPGSGSPRTIPAWYSGTGMAFDIETPFPVRVSIYMVDWDVIGRSMDIHWTEPTYLGATILAPVSITGYDGGIWKTYDIEGSVAFWANNTGPANAVITGFFFDPIPSTPPPSANPFFFREFIMRER